MESKDSFNAEVKHLFNQLTAVYDERDKRILNLDSKPDPMRIALNKYINVYSKTEPGEHTDYFLNLFNKNKAGILQVIKSDDWLKKDGVFIVFGEGTQHAKTSIAIRISHAYKIAVENREQAEVRLKGLPESASAECYELIRPEIILLHLYRIFREVITDKDDKAAVSSIVTHYERMLNMKEQGSKATTPSPNNPLDTLGSNPLGGLAQIFSSVVGSMQNINSSMANGMTGPLPPINGENIKEISNALNGVLTNPSTQSLMTQLLSGLGNQSDPISALSTIGQKVSDPSFLEALRSTIPSTTNAALQGQPSSITPVSDGKVEVAVVPTPQPVTIPIPIPTPTGVTSPLLPPIIPIPIPDKK